jgi:hypothetical protein
MANFPAFYAAGNVPEAVINQLFMISPTETLFTSMIEQNTEPSGKHEFLKESLATPNPDNAAVDGAAISLGDSTGVAEREWDWCQLTERNIALGSQAETSDGFGNITKFSRQLRDRTFETRRDREATYMSNNESVMGVEGATPGASAGFFACISTNVDTDGTAGGWDGTNVYDAPIVGTTRALSEAAISAVHQAAYTAGGNVDCFMMIPSLKAKWTDFMFTSSARIGAIYTPTQPGGSGATAIGSIQMYESNWGAVEVKANRVMQPVVATPGSRNTSFALIDSSKWANSVQFDVRAERLAKDGHADNWMVESSWTLLPLNEASSGGLLDIDDEAPMEV